MYFYTCTLCLCIHAHAIYIDTHMHTCMCVCAVYHVCSKTQSALAGVAHWLGVVLCT